MKLRIRSGKYEKQLINAEESARGNYEYKVKFHSASNVDFYELATCEVSHFHKYVDNIWKEHAIRSVDCMG